MGLDSLLNIPVNKNLTGNNLIKIELQASNVIEVYENSINPVEGGVVFIGKMPDGKYLFLLLNEKHTNLLWDRLVGEEELSCRGQNARRLKKCKLSHVNAEIIKEVFPFTRAVVIGLTNSIGLGDRLGLANPGHLRALNGSAFRPVLAQQSIRELTRTQRTPDEVMDAAVWAVLQEGYKSGFGSDADHLKTIADIDLMMKAGFTMFTFDPCEYVNNSADTIREDELNSILTSINWDRLDTTSKIIIDKYTEKQIYISENLSLAPNETDVKRAIIKYGNAIAHLRNLYEHIRNNYPESSFEIEVSVDETESVTSPFEHFFIANELKRLGVEFVSLAPRFIGDFEKGIDYKGNIAVFKQEYLKHLAIVKYFGTYKISLHSGSDKFAVYKVIGSINQAFTHVKTAGTSYLEALKVVASRRPDLFREILDYARGFYESEKKSYHVSADINKVEEGKEYSDKELAGLFDSDDVRQVLHVTFGKVLSDKNQDGTFKFKNRILECLNKNEDFHYELLEKHFKKHLDPFVNLKFGVIK